MDTNLSNEEIIDLQNVYIGKSISNTDSLEKRELIEYLGEDKPNRLRKGWILTNNRIGWFLTDKGDLVLDEIRKTYGSYLSEEILKNFSLKEKVEKIFYSNHDEIGAIWFWIQDMKNLKEFCVNPISKEISYIKGVRGLTSGHVDDLDD